MTILGFMIRRVERRQALAALDRQLIAQRFYSYVRIGHDQRTMEFLPDHRIGRGADLLEQEWRVASLRGTPVLQIKGSGAITCRLSPADDRAWHGRWLAHEMMEIRLRPIADPHPPLPGPAVAAAHALLRADGGTRPAYELLQHYRRTVASDPEQKHLLPVNSATHATRPFGRRVGQLSDEVLFCTLRDPSTGRTYWAKRYGTDHAKQLEWELNLYRSLPARDSRIVRPVDFTEQHGLIFEFDRELFEGRAVHLRDIAKHFSGNNVAEIRDFAATVVRHPDIGPAQLAELTDFQTIGTSRGLRFLDFALQPKHWWML